MKRLIVLALVAAVFLLQACHDKLELPPSTESGANTFGVKINDRIWIPEYASNVFGAPEKLSALYSKNSLGITARKGVNNELIVLTAIEVKSVGTYSLNSSDNNGAIESSYSGKAVDDTYLLQNGAQNIIRITKLDTVSKIVSGSFEMQLIGKNKKSILKFTQGTFDIKYEN